MAPMFVVADWHGRVVDYSLSLRGGEESALQELRAALARFDRGKAAKPPPALPSWAAALAAPGGAAAMARYLEERHPRSGAEPPAGGLDALAGVYRALEREGEILEFGLNFCQACRDRAPSPGMEYIGHRAEAKFLAELAWCRNDRVKFEALSVFGAFAPPSEVGFLVERARRCREGARNGNVVLCRCLEAYGALARRFPGARDAATAGDRRRLVEALAFPAGVLKTEERNNSACKLAAEAIAAVAETTGAPEALAAYFHCLAPSRSGQEWLVKMAERFRADARRWLAVRTPADLGPDPGPWREWYRREAGRLFYDRGAGRFVLDAAAAEAMARELDRWEGRSR